MLASIPKRRVATSPYPAPSPVVALILLFESLEVAPHQLIGIQLLDHLALLVGQAIEILWIAEPLVQFVVCAQLALDTVKHPGEDAIECVVISLALDQRGLSNVVESQEIGIVKPLLQARHEHLPFLHSDRNTFVTQTVKEIQKHLVCPNYWRATDLSGEFQEYYISFSESSPRLGSESTNLRALGLPVLIHDSILRQSFRQPQVTSQAGAERREG